MELIRQIIFLMFFLIFVFGDLQAQVVNYVGLSNKHLTSLKVGEGLVAIGTNLNGVYWQPLNQLNDSSWNKIDIDSVNVTAVYPHKSGPIGWAIGIGTKPNVNDTNFIYCSYLGSKPKTLSYGIDTQLTKSITRIDGFPDPTICGETFAIGGRKLYRRYFTDSVWHSVYDLTIEGSFESLKAREEFAEVYAGGAEGFAGMLLIRTFDKGNTWENLSPLCNVSDVDFWNGEDTTIFVTDRFKVMRSTDNGRTWKNVFQTDSLGIQKISFSADGKIFYMVSNSTFYNYPRSYFSYTYDYGKHWVTEQLPVYDIIVGMDLDAENNIYVAYITSGVFKISSPVVNVDEPKNNNLKYDFKLYANYPNPFNPSTIISYQLPDGGFVNLKIFNSIGEEVRTLLDEYQQPGFHSVIYNANTSIPSGVYYYKLNTKNYSATGKMVFTK